MATSGTLATTTIDTATLIEHAARRCGILPAQQTPEFVKVAQENLFMLMLALANRGLNLWCVDKNIIGCTTGQAGYAMPPGTLGVVNVVFSMPTRVTGTDSSTTTSFTTDAGVVESVVRIGVRCSTLSPADTLVLEHSPDGVTFSPILTDARTDFATDTWYWYALDPCATDQYFRVSTLNPVVVRDFYLASNVYDLPVSPWNRDTYAVMNDKSRQGRPSVSYFFEKKTTPRITLWPVPNNDYDQITIWRHRQIQDIGTMQQELDIPARWIDNVVAQLAYRVALCWAGVDAARIEMLKGLADEAQITVEGDENDGMPVYLVPNISVYNR